MRCSDCPFEAKSRAGLAAHRRRRHPESLPGPGGPNVRAIVVTLGELRRMGRLEKVDEARVQALRSMAEALDQNPFNSQMWREYREALEGLTADDSSSDAVDDLLDELSSPVRDQA
jgi:hypothetical protein